MDIKKIAIIAVSSRGGGSETFLRGLLPELVLQSPFFEYHLFIAKSREKFYKDISTKIIIHSINDKKIENNWKRFIFDNFEIYSMIKEIMPDLCFYNSEIVNPLLKKIRIPIINMYHAALQFYMIPGVDDSRWKLFYIRKMRDLSMHFVDKTVAVSNYEKAELGGRYPKLMFNKFIVIYHGINLNLFNNFRDDMDIKNLSNKPFILCVSDRYRHKKIDNMLKIYKILKEKYKIIEDFIIIGRSKSEIVDLELFDYIKRNDLENCVRFIDYIDNQDIYKYYNNAKLLWTNSSCESFGLTPLEAMACGTPVVSSWESALPEIYGNSVCFYNPNLQKNDEIADILHDIISNDEIREKYIRLGLDHSKNFSWEKAANNYFRLFNNEINK